MDKNWNLPPGVTPNMIPGNTPEDVFIDKMLDKADCIACESYDDCGLIGSSCVHFKEVSDHSKIIERNDKQE